MEKEYIIFCDESETHGRFFSNFYGGVMVGSSQYDRITQRLNAEKQRLNLFGEVKWSKVSEPYLAKYQELSRKRLSRVQKDVKDVSDSLEVKPQPGKTSVPQ